LESSRAAAISGGGRSETSSARDEQHKEGHTDEHKERGVVTLSRERQKEFGIESANVTSEEFSIPISATAVIELNADRISKISPRVSGKIVSVLASQGDRVGPTSLLPILTARRSILPGRNT